MKLSGARLAWSVAVAGLLSTAWVSLGHCATQEQPLFEAGSRPTQENLTDMARDSRSPFIDQIVNHFLTHGHCARCDSDDRFKQLVGKTGELKQAREEFEAANAAYERIKDPEQKKVIASQRSQVEEQIAKLQQQINELTVQKEQKEAQLSAPTLYDLKPYMYGVDFYHAFSALLYPFELGEGRVFLESDLEFFGGVPAWSILSFWDKRLNPILNGTLFCNAAAELKRVTNEGKKRMLS